MEQAIKCDQFQRLPDGTWSSKDVSLDYVQDGKRYQLNYGNGAILTGKKDAEEARLVAALDKKCAAPH
jgi:hypothetical protein